MRVITLATPDTLARARSLARSLARTEPDWVHEILLLATERVTAGLRADGEQRVVRSVCEELDVDVEALLALHREEELGALLVPHLLRAEVRRSSDSVLHLPSSTWILAPMQPVEAALSRHQVLLVPRLEGELPPDGLQPSRIQLERAGRIEPTIMGVTPGADAEAFLAWWQERVERMLGSLDARRSGARPEDRDWLARYLELAPARFTTGVLEDPGCNLSSWNLHARELSGTAAAPIVAGRPVRFLNLPGFEPDHPHRLSRTATRARVSRSPVLHELCERYASELRESGWTDADHHGEVGRRLDGELIYDDSLRSIYRTALALGEPLDDLFSETSSRAFIAWLEAPSPRGGRHGVNRYLFHRVARERPDVVRAYPDLDGPDGAAFLQWCRTFGRDEISIPERFIPVRNGSAPVDQPSALTGPGNPSPAADFPDSAGSAGQSARGAPTTGDGAVGARESRVELAVPAPNDEFGVAVRLTGYLGHTLGLGAAARGYVRALGASGVPVSTVSVPLHHVALPGELGAEYGRHGFDELVHDGRHGVELVAVNADELPDLVARVGDDYFQGPRVGIWGWETNSIPPRWSRAFALIDEVWVYSRFMAENIGAAAPVPVFALPPPVEAPALPATPLRLGVPEGFLFLFVFDYLSTVQRKNPVGLIEAFKAAFPDGDGARLLIKTINAPLRPLAEEELLWAAHGREDIHIVDRSLTSADLDGVMAACDCYVSLHRAEGFGLTMAEAMAIGKPVIGTGYSGNVDFMKPANSFLVNYKIGRVGPDCEIYPPEGEWAEPDVAHAVELMRRVHSDPAEARAKGEVARADVARLLSAEATGRKMRERLERLLAGGLVAGPVLGAR